MGGLDVIAFDVALRENFGDGGTSLGVVGDRHLLVVESAFPILDMC